ncbi:MAG: bifunctional DNA primase/polymerase [Pseudomonadota bacterium]
MSNDRTHAEQSALTEMAGLAIRLHRLGYVCVPLRAGGKHLDLAAMGVQPVHLQCRSKRLKELAFTSVLFQLALNPPGESAIAAWLSGRRANIGLVCGVNGLVAIDFDKPDLYAAWRRRHEAIVGATPVCKSPAGYHVLVRHGLPLVSSSLHLGFRRAGHIKALGGYVACAPTSLAHGGAYRWLPGQSPIDVEPQQVESLGDMGLYAVSPLKRAYDGMLGRGSFEDH